jgi:3-phosphoshikimate 1-carboxyvinyltransferase
MSYPTAIGLVKTGIQISNYQGRDPFQADDRFLDLLKDWGGKWLIDGSGLRIFPSVLDKEMSFDAARYPDLIPTLCFLASYSQNPCEFINLNVLKYKECDRFTEIIKILELFNITHDTHEDVLKIYPSQKITKKMSYTGPNDHRMVMLASLFMVFNSGGVIENSDVVKKSYPNFFESFLSSD